MSVCVFNALGRRVHLASFTKREKNNNPLIGRPEKRADATHFQKRKGLHESVTFVTRGEIYLTVVLGDYVKKIVHGIVVFYVIKIFFGSEINK